MMPITGSDYEGVEWQEVISTFGFISLTMWIIALGIERKSFSKLIPSIYYSVIYYGNY